MAVDKRDKVSAILDLYAEGGSLQQAMTVIGLRKRDYYLTLRAHPDLKQLSLDIQQDRADMMGDEVYELSTDAIPDPALRARADVRFKLMSFYDRRRFGDKLDIQVDAGPSLIPMLEARKQRALQPLCDLSQVTDAEYEALPSPQGERATDSQSDAPPPGAIDPFEP